MTERTFTAAEMRTAAEMLAKWTHVHGEMDPQSGTSNVAAMLRQGADAKSRWDSLQLAIRSGYLRQPEAILSEMARLEQERTA